MAGEPRTRIYGPYPNKRGGFEVILIEPPEPGEERGARSARRFAGEEEAHRWVAHLEKELELEGPITIEGALDGYRQWLAGRGCRASTVATTLQRLRRALGDVHRTGPLRALAAGAVREQYARLAATLSCDTQRNILGEAARFGRWCVKQGWCRRSPWEAVEPVGRRRRGKVQLRVDEARSWLAKAMELAEAGDESAVAALCCLLLGLRASEVVERVGRDVDDGGALLWIDRSKTEAGRRTVVVPEMLRPFLVHLQGLRPGGVRLFGDDRHWLAYHVRRICQLAGVTVVCPHGLRGTHASLAMTAGASSQLVASSLGHASPAVTLAHYAKPEAVASGQADRALKMLRGGKR